MKKLIQKGKPSTQSTIDDCIGGWDLSELEVIDDNNANNANNANNDNNTNNDNNDNNTNNANNANNANNDEVKKNEF